MRAYLLKIAPYLVFTSLACFAIEVPIYDFPLAAYSQNADDYIPPNDKNYHQPLISDEYQRQQLKQFYQHYYASDAQGLSPWNGNIIMAVLPVVKKNQPKKIENFNNLTQSGDQKHYAENYKLQTPVWLNKMRARINLSALATSAYLPENRAIAVHNTFARTLPDLAPDFFSLTLAGEGFPFDNLQESSIWAGTPLYVLNLSTDHAWALVFTPDGYCAWVSSEDIAYVTPAFIQKWQTVAKHGLVAVTQTEVSIFDQAQKFQLTGYIGSVFPMIQQNHQQFAILIPVKRQNQQAVLKTGIIAASGASQMPLPATPKNFVKIINQLKNRPYGWGGKFFFNDCSQEMKSLFTPFGIWLPRNSSQQAKLNSTFDFSKNTVDARINLLTEKAHPLMTLIYIGRHIILYVGKKDLGEQLQAPITYQNLWGLSPKKRDKRYVIGQSVFLPILKTYPEHPSLVSHAGETLFQLIFLDQLTPNSDSPDVFVSKFIAAEPSE